MAKRLKATERRASIIAVAKVLFADSGYHGVSVDDIAKRLGVSPAVLYQHFESKESLYEAVLNEITERRESYVDAVLSGQDDFASVLRNMTNIYTRSVARDPDYLKMEMHNVLEGASAAQQFFDSRWKSFSDFIEVGMQELAPKKRVNNTNPRIASLMYQGMVREVLYAKCISNSPRYKDISLERLVDDLVNLFLHAIDYRPEQS